jgi:hypothetical protein
MRFGPGLRFPSPARAALVVAVAAGLLCGAAPALAVGPATPDLGTAARFAVLAGGGITDTGPSTITGDVGTYPRPAISSVLDAAVRGTVHRAGDTARLAQLDLAAAYDVAAGATPTAALPSGGDGTVFAGVYRVAATSKGIAGRLTLDARDDPDAVWIFSAAGDLVTAPGSRIQLVNGARSCNVFWQVGGSVKLGSGSVFGGIILANSSVTIGTGVTLDGRVLARNAGVSLAGDTIVAPPCSTRGDVASVSVRQPAAASQAATLVSRTSVPGGNGPRLPAYVPIILLLALAAAVVLGEPRRARDDADDGRH